jgi:acyl carrier protein
MDRETLKQSLLALLEESRGEKYDHFDESLDIRTELGLDSIDLVSLILDVQGKLGVRIDIADLEPVRTVSQLLDLLQARLGGGQSGQGNEGSRRVA